jgi:hypothetical protein
MSAVVQLLPQAPEVSGIVLTLPGHGAVSGRVLNQIGYFVAGAEVQCGSVKVSSTCWAHRIPAGPGRLANRHSKIRRDGITTRGALRSGWTR